jgi:hypothetical protein
MKRDNDGDPEIAGEARVDLHAPTVGGASASALDDARRRIKMEMESVVDAPTKRTRGRPRRGGDGAVSGGMAPTMEQWGMLIEALKHNNLADQETAATFHALAMKKALRPENEFPTGISTYNPTGGERPKPTCDYYLNGFPAPGQPVPRQGFPICTPNDTFTVTNTEITLLNTLQAGTYPVTKADGTQTKAGVVQHRDHGGKVTATVIMIQIADDEQKNNWPPLVQLLTEITTGETPARSYARMEATIKDLESKLAAQSA